MTNVPSGCPQGTSSALILFLIFVNDIIDICDQVQIKLFADDIKIFVPLRNINHHIYLQDCLNRIYDWSILW